MASILDLMYRFVDPQLNYGREAIVELARRCGHVETILDVAAGSGSDLANVRQYFPTPKLIAFDFVVSSIAALQAEGIEAHQLNLEHDTFPVADNSIDLVIANQVLEHAKEIFWIFDQICRSLSPNGHLLLGVPNLASLHNRILLALGLQPTPIRSASAHVRGFTRSDVIDFVESCFPGGLELIAYKGANFYPFPPPIARPLSRLLPSMAWGNFYLFRLTRAYNGEFLRFPVEQRLETNFYTGNPSC